MYYASRLEDRLGLFSATLAVACFCLVFLGLTMPGGAPGLALPAYAAEPGGHAVAAPNDATAGGPVRVVVPALGVDSAVRPVALDHDQVLTPPSDPDILGWWSASARPGTPGRTVLTGHTVHTGGGALEHLGRLHRDDLVRVTTRAGTQDYRVSRVSVLSTAQVQKHSIGLFGQDRPDTSLLLVTCTGWNGTVFTENVLVTAVPVATGTAT